MRPRVALLGLLAACAGPAAPAGQPQDTAGGADTVIPAIPVASGPTSGTSPDHDRDGFTADLDCDDDDRDSYPGAPEACGDGVINNCAERPHLGETEDCLLLGPEDAFSSMRLSSIYTTETGLDVSVVGDVDGDGQWDIGIGSSGDGWVEEVWDPEHAVWVQIYHVTGAISVHSGLLSTPSDEDVLIRDLPRFLGPSEEYPIGASLGGVGDIDGDGYDDLVVGDEQNNDGVSPDHGWLVWGPAALSDWDRDALLLRTADNISCAFSRPGPAGDLTGDGQIDLILNDRCTDTVYLLSGAGLRAGELSPVVELAEPSAIWYGFGHAVMGDVDLTGDGLVDLVVGAPLRERRVDVVTDVGFVALFEGPLTAGSGALLTPDDALLRLDAEDKVDWSEYRRFGSEVSAGDMNGDGYADLALGDPSCYRDPDVYGVAYVFAGPIEADLRTEDAVFNLLGEAYAGRGYVGGEIDLRQDLDGDGRADLFTSGGNNIGELGGPGGYYAANKLGWVVRAPLAGSLRERYADLILNAPDIELWAYQSMATPDITGDGRPDLLIGGPSNSYHLFASPW
ncbi:MAG: hypothetical protein RL071_4436 [Pseudomonadota bacterium]|jgi:hypothetical protein